VQYATTTDGLSIAFSVLGEGPALVEMPPIPFRYFERSWQFPEERRWMERLARGRQLIEYDPRGLGLSQREVSDWSGEALCRDIDAVLDHAGVERATLLAFLNCGPIAIAYALSRPERVSHLILWCSAARLVDAIPAEFHALLSLAETHWDLFTEASMRAYRGWEAGGDAAHRQAAFLRECVTRETMLGIFRAGREIDVSAQLEKVEVPTLVVHARDVAWLAPELARQLASRIPGARLAVVEGGVVPFARDFLPAARLIDEFLGTEALAGDAPARASEPSAGIATILFTDIAGSTAFIERLGDAAAREVLRTYERVVRHALQANAGVEIKTTGDGFLGSFSSALRALDCAIEIQQGVARLGEQAPDRALRLRVGLNAGEPVGEDDDLFGIAVNVAARTAARADPGQILVTDVVRQLVAGKRFRFSDRGLAELKGLDAPVRLHELHWREDPGPPGA
jgi:class 3 adenylate cyclase